MPTLELFTIPSDPTACHNVMTPGGYETWTFEFDADREVVAISFGYGCGADYLKRYRAYRARPTKVSPPSPRDYATVGCVAGASHATVASIAANEFIASSERLEITTPVGRCVARADGAIEVVVRHADVDCELVIRDGMATGRIAIGAVRLDPYRGAVRFEHKVVTNREGTRT